MTGIRAGQLNRRLRFQSRSTAQDSFGAQQATWTDVATVWADIQPLTGRELLTAQAMNVEVSHQITIRWQPAFANPKTVAAMRAVYGSRIFDIHASLNDNERNRVLVLLASEGLTEG